MAEPRILIISLDGATWDLLDPFIAQGRMPFLASLMTAGSRAILKSVLPPLSAPAWASFQTGKNPGKHGITDFTQQKPGSHQATLVNSQSIATPTVWQILSQRGKTVGVLNLPLTYPPQALKGVLVSGLLTPDLQRVFTYPSSLSQEILQKFPDYELFVPPGEIHFLGVKGFADQMVDAINRRIEVAQFLMSKCDWDVFMVHIHETDTLQHALWDHLDANHPSYDTYSVEQRNYVQGVYTGLDTALGQFLQGIAAPHPLVFILSDHGFGPTWGTIYLNKWLATEGYLVTRFGAISRGMLDAVARVVKKTDFLKLRKRLLKNVNRHSVSLNRLRQDAIIDWTKTRANAVFGSQYGRIYINRSDQQPQGQVSANTNSESLCDEIAERLLDWKHPHTGASLIRRIYRRDEIYHGSQVPLLPDLLVEPVEGYRIATRLDGPGLLRDDLSEEYGSHRVDGIFLASGPEIQRGVRMGHVELVDIAPTILYLLDLAIPTDMDGRPLVEVMADPSKRSVRYAISDLEAVGTDEQVAVNESRAVLDRLRGLGYLD